MKRKIRNVWALGLIFLMLSSLVNGFLIPRGSANDSAYYVDSVNGNDANSGISPDNAWKTLNKVNSTIFNQGDKILFKAGCTWNGELHPQGSGAEGNNIIIDMFGSGNKPIINGPGTSWSQAFHLYNQQYWTIQNLELTNDAQSEDYRYGVLIEGGAAGVLNSIYIRNLDIHNVKGRHDRSSTSYGHEAMYYCGGIYIKISSDAAPITRFNDLKIENNYIHDITTIGITSIAPESYNMNDSRFSTNVIIRNNIISKTGCDLIDMGYCDGLIVENNEGSDAGYYGDMSTQYIAGMWGYNLKNPVFRYNSCVRTRKFKGDGQPWDADWGCIGTFTYEYNYSRDNWGGWLLEMNWRNENLNKTIVRYNISQNDGGSNKDCILKLNKGTIVAYNNIIYCPDSKISVSAGGSKFYNNIFVGNSSSSYSSGTYDYNCYYGNNGPNDSHKLIANPLFVDPGKAEDTRNTADGYKLQNNSPCINAGTIIADNGGKDFWENSIYKGAPDIGAHESIFGENQPNSIIINDNDVRITYSGSWIYSNNRLKYNATDINYDVHSTKTNGSYAEYTFEGSAIDLIAEKNSDQGNIDIYIDDVFQNTVNCFNQSRSCKQVIYSKNFDSVGIHKIKVVKKTGVFMLIDAFRVYY